MQDSLRAVWAFRGFVWASVIRDFRLRYLNSLFGATWAIVGPLAMIFVYTVIFSQVMASRLPGVAATYAYSIYLFAGVLAWNLFSDILNGCVTVFVDHANLIKKLNFPRMCLPLIVTLNALINFAAALSIFLIFLLISGSFPGWEILGILPLLFLQIAFALALGVLLGIVNVFFRDVGHFLKIGLLFWFWLTPIVYPVSVIPEPFRPWFALNPMTSLISGYQQIFVYAQAPDILTLVPLILLTMVLAWMSHRLFQQRGDDLVDEL